MPPPRRADRQLPLIESPIDRTPRPVARVAIDRPIDRVYSYGIPCHLLNTVRPGQRVLVPFGRNERPAVGMCVAVTDEAWETALRNIEQVLDEAPLLGPRLLELGEWISRYYCCPLGTTLAAMVPAPVKEQAGLRRVRFAGALVDRNAANGGEPRPTAKQSAVMQTLWQRDPPELPIAELRRAAGIGEGPIKKLADRGWLAIETRLVDQRVLPAETIQDPQFQLTEDQRNAIEQIRKIVDRGQFRSILLFGVTGSGKTEVYVQAIRHVVNRGHQAILLIPEIALTTQTAQRLAQRFVRTAVLHASLPPAQRARAWRAIAAGDIDVVIGTRSAVFAPLPRLGLIVVDEEQESSYKNLASPRYNTRDVATKRAQLESIPIVLGSATPSLETWYNCQRATHFERIELPERVRDLPMPTTELVDLRKLTKGRDLGTTLLSWALESALRRTLADGQQAVLLLNRRGYSNLLMCSVCGHVTQCPHCRRNLVYHRQTRRLLCHYCHYQIPEPRLCEVMGCGGKVMPVGMGTQRVVEEVARKIPQARLARMDSDAISEATAGGLALTGVARYRKILNDFEAGRTNLLIGTQMIAKGLDFPNLTLVGIVNADTSLGLPDFRAAERTFQLVSQVAGRAGRAHLPGHVIVQSLHPSEPAIQRALAHDYPGFAELELEQRRQAQLPPITRMARIVLSDRSHQRAAAAAADVADQAKDLSTAEKLPIQVLGPAPAAIERLRDQFRFDVRLLAPTASDLQAMLGLMRGHKALSPRARNILIDVDPLAVL